MNTLCKTKKGTIGAYWFGRGIALGLSNYDNFISLEYDEKADKLKVLLREDLMKRQGFELVKVDDHWKEICK